MKRTIKITEGDLKKVVFDSVRAILNEEYNKFIKPTDSVSEKFFHVSNPINRESIIQKGLLPSVGDSYRCHSESDNDLTPVVFMSKNNNYDSTWDDDRWEIDSKYLDKNSIFNDFDPYMKDSFVYTKNIPPKALKLIYKGSGKDMLREENDSLSVRKENEMMRFYIGNEEVGGLCYTIGYIDTIISEYEDSVNDFNPRIMHAFDSNNKILNIEDIWINRGFRGHGLFRQELHLALDELKKISRQFILRACSDNGFPEDKLVKIYSDFGFRILQETDEDGVIMGLII